MGLSPKTGISNDAGISPVVGVGTEGISLSGEAAYTGPLDLVPGAVVAYGVRALSAAWLGQNIFRLRRDSDDAEMDFAADAVTGDAPVVSIVAWRDAEGAADAFLVTLYDQAGTGKNVSYTTVGAQALFVESILGGKCGFVQDQGDAIVLEDTSISFDAPVAYSGLAVGTFEGTTSFRAYLGSSRAQANFADGGAEIEVNDGTHTCRTNYPDDDSTVGVIDFDIRDGNRSLYVNGVLKTPSGIIEDALDPFVITDIGINFGETFCEALLYATAEDNSARTSGRDNQMTYYSLP